jgi:hypothetical protein
MGINPIVKKALEKAVLPPKSDDCFGQKSNHNPVCKVTGNGCSWPAKTKNEKKNSGVPVASTAIDENKKKRHSISQTVLSTLSKKNISLSS